MTHEYTLLVGGRILPGPDRPRVAALAWAADTVIALGSDAAVREASRGDSLESNLGGLFVIPVADGGDAIWPPTAVLEVGGPADCALLAADPRRSSVPLRPVALVRGGWVVEGVLPAGKHGPHATDDASAVFSGVMDTDTALVARLARDLDAAFPDLVASHVDRLYTIALRQLGSASDAEEVAQDALVRAHRAMAGYEPDRIAGLQLRPWLAAITINLARNRRRRRSDREPAHSLEPLIEAGFDPPQETSADPVAVATGRESADELAALLLRLPVSMRMAIVLRHVDGLSVAETAAALGRPEGTIKAQVSRGLDRLREMLAASTDPGGGRARETRAAGRPQATPLPSSFSDGNGGRILAAAEVLR